MEVDVNVKVRGKVQDPSVRVTNFEEVEQGYNDEEALSEAARCLTCPKPRCVEGCPVGIAIPEFIKCIKEGNPAGAYEVISRTSSLPAVCGRVCPQEKQCEAKCVRGIKGEAVSIGALERYAADYAIKNNLAAANIPEKNGKKVAIFGSYDWGDGQWLRDWADRLKNAGAEVINGEGLKINLTPDDDGLAECKKLGAMN